ncbi:MAG TPA: energy transducer TonB [Bryobacteraceae bacterium]|jgi:protein TonB
MRRLKMLLIPVAAVVALSAIFTLTAQEPTPKKTSPKVLYQMQPEYTEAARTAKVSGSVLLKLTVDENGDAQDIQVVRSLDEGLDQNAIEAVRQWRFAPGTEDGKPVAVSANIEVNFKLQ